MSKSKKLPAFQFYPGDWMKDPSLQSVSLAAKGLWITMLCLMHESPERGVLLHSNGLPITPDHLSRISGEDAEQIILELLNTGVTERRESDNSFVCRRMCREETARQKMGYGGRKGGSITQAKRAMERESMVEPMVSESPTQTISMASTSTSTSTSTSKDISASRFFRVRQDQDVAKVVNKIPKSRLTKYKETCFAIDDALSDLIQNNPDDAQMKDRPQAAEYLSQKITAYYESTEGQSGFWRQPLTWIEQMGYLEDESTWESRKRESAESAF